LADTERGFGGRDIEITDGAVEHWATLCDGDARRALTALEVAVLSTTPGAGGRVTIDLAIAEESIQGKAVVYSGDGDEHYDAISAMIKSVRGSDPDAAIYWIARMLEGGEDPRFIARRLAILASEDIGNADPRAITVAASMWTLVERIGMPEARIPLAQCAAYLALAPKSNAAYLAINAAMDDVREGRTLPVPVFLRDGTKARSEGSPEEGAGYDYSHAHEANTSIGPVTGQDYLGVEKRYYQPTEIGFEKTLAERLREVRSVRQTPP
jgi:putative ATPase